MRSKYLAIKDSAWRRLVRWLFHKYLDEPYFPDDMEVVRLVNGTIVLRWKTTNIRRGQCEEYIYE